ncbi:hypothetical protein LBMAG34_4750 [Candidatus Saccharibacteria bacterium]|nr:hypothetical protein LBMAG34_4750 [Candidatus Saccharibacteria bacterium]
MKKLKNSLAIKIALIAVVATFSFVGLAGAMHAQSNSGDNKTGADVCGVLPPALCDAVLTGTASNSNPLGGLQPLLEFIMNIMISLFGAFAVLVLIVSGIQISASAGNENVVKSAKENIFKIVTGLVLLISFRAILGLINTAFEGVNTSSLFGATGNELNPEGIPKLLGNIISIASFISGIVAVIFIIVAGIRYITSAGNAKAREGAQKTLIYAIGGLVLSISAYGILTFIQDQLTK